MICWIANQEQCVPQERPLRCDVRHDTAALLYAVRDGAARRVASLSYSAFRRMILLLTHSALHECGRYRRTRTRYHIVLAVSRRASGIARIRAYDDECNRHTRVDDSSQTTNNQARTHKHTTYSSSFKYTLSHSYSLWPVDSSQSAANDSSSGWTPSHGLTGWTCRG